MSFFIKLVVAKDYIVIYYGCKQMFTPNTKGGQKMLIVFKDPDEFRKKLLVSGYSSRSFATQVGLSSPYFSQIINNKRNPSGKVAKKIVDELSVAFDDIFFIQGVSKSDQSGEYHEE